MATRFVHLIFIGAAILLLDAKTDAQEWVSPCPRLFAYELMDTETDKWYGIITLISDIELTGVWLSIIFDSPALQLGNWFGDVEVKMDDNRDYLIMNRSFKLLANYPYPLRFYIKYDPSKSVPRLESFRLNGRTVCPEGQTTTVSPLNFGRLFTNKLAESTTSIAPTSLAPPKNSSASTNNNRPISGLSKSNDDGYIPADFNFTADVNSNVECGTIAPQAIPLITYGQKTEAGQFPWHAAVYYSRNAALNYLCSGSLISRLHVLTVAHCVSNVRTYLLHNKEDLLVFLGKYHLRSWSDPGIQSFTVSRLVRFPSFDSKTYFNDVAIITLSQPAEFSDFVRPICLWEGSTDFNLTGTYGSVVGWGYDENGKLTEELKMLDMPVVSKATCIFSYPDFFAKFVNRMSFCAGFRNGSSVCNGDSGGGMVFPRNTENPNKKVYQIRGIISVSVPLRNESKCDPTHYVVLTDVAQYIDFIKKIIAQ